MIKAFNGRKILKFIISVAIPLAVGYFSSLAAGDFEEAYEAAMQPSFTPPPWVFPVVWSVLYTVLGVSLFLIIKDGSSSPDAKDALFYFAISLVMNFFWSPIFFRWRLILLALVWLGAMIALGIAAAYRAYCVNKAAGFLWIPYVIWLVFAFALNVGYYILNGATV